MFFFLFSVFVALPFLSPVFFLSPHLLFSALIVNSSSSSVHGKNQIGTSRKNQRGKRNEGCCVEFDSTI
jgi:hypothetical protein